MSFLTERAQGLSRRVGPPNSQWSGPSRDAALVERPPQPPDRGVRHLRPGEQRLEIADQAVDAVPLDLEAEVAPGALVDRAEIIVGDVEAADDRLVGRRPAPASGGCAADSAGPSAARSGRSAPRPRPAAGRSPPWRATRRSRRRAARPATPRSGRRDQGVAHPPPGLVVAPRYNKARAAIPAPRRSGRSAPPAAPARPAAGSACCRRPPSARIWVSPSLIRADA